MLNTLQSSKTDYNAITRTLVSIIDAYQKVLNDHHMEPHSSERVKNALLENGLPAAINQYWHEADIRPKRLRSNDPTLDDFLIALYGADGVVNTFLTILTRYASTDDNWMKSPWDS